MTDTQVRYMFYCRTKTVTRDELEALRSASLNADPTEIVYWLKDRETRKWEKYIERRLQLALRSMIHDYLARGWVITKRDPLTLYRGRAGYQLQNGVLVSL